MASRQRQSPPAVRQVAFLRGINVGRNKRVAMADLRRVVGGLGYADVSTHLQSGNVMVTSTEPPVELERQVELALRAELGLDCRVVARTRDEVARAAQRAAGIAAGGDSSRFLVGFLAGDPAPDALSGLSTDELAPEEVQLHGRELYLWCPDGILASAVAGLPWDRRLGVPVTMRNRRTVEKLLELLDGVRIEGPSELGRVEGE